LAAREELEALTAMAASASEGNSEKASTSKTKSQRQSQDKEKKTKTTDARSSESLHHPRRSYKDGRTAEGMPRCKKPIEIRARVAAV
jgi:hypothetical protein